MILMMERVSIPAWSSIGYGWGRDPRGRMVSFIGDHRALHDIGEALSEIAHRAWLDPKADDETLEEFTEAVRAEVELDQIVDIEEAEE